MAFFQRHIELFSRKIWTQACWSPVGYATGCSCVSRRRRGVKTRRRSLARYFHGGSAISLLRDDKIDCALAAPFRRRRHCVYEAQSVSGGESWRISVAEGRTAANWRNGCGLGMAVRRRFTESRLNHDVAPDSVAVRRSVSARRGCCRLRQRQSRN